MSASIPQDMLDRISLGVRQHTSSPAWREYLAFQAKLYRYSFLNTLLIRLARGTHVAGFHRWLELGRHVRRGEKGIAILAPMRRSATVEDEETGEHRRVHRITGFRIVHVFDVSQTDGDALPEIPCHRLTGEAPDHVVDRLVELARGLGYTVELDAAFANTSKNGETAPAERRISIRADLSPAHRVKTLAHELAHAILHADALSTGTHDYDLGELEAESVAFVVTGALGIDAGDYSFGYLASWLHGQDPEAAMQLIGERVQRTSRQILDALDDAQAVAA